MDLGTALVSLGGGTGAIVVSYVLNATKATKGEMKLRDERIDTLRKDLNTCEGNCIDAKAAAARAERRADEATSSALIERDGRLRAESTADHWRELYEKERDRAR